jgi:tetracycline resistance efflux pump
MHGSDITIIVAATLGGGIFGDHCSPISDTSIISSMASASDHIDHVKTQLPYALIGGAVTVFMYLIIGFFG